MAYQTRQRRAELNSKITNSTTQNKMDSVTIGIVVDTNDPMQQGRVRAVCQRWGDTFNMSVDDISWASYVTPFGGSIHTGTRGPGIDDASGGTAYGMWAIPKVGAQVVVMCLDSAANQRVYIGCLYDDFAPHTLPHGRFMYDDHPNLDSTIIPAGPYTSDESKLEPLWDNMRQAFGNKAAPNFEWQTRAADYTASAVDVSELEYTYSSVADDKDIEKDGWKSNQGYQTNRQDPKAPSTHTDRNLDNMVYSITSPGFHAISMDDRQENSRMRIRTAAGHQIIMDDTNERIYIASARGDNWIEMDQNGNIDVFSNNKISLRAKQGINMTSDEDIRMTAAKGIHMFSPENIHIQSGKDVQVLAGQNIRLQADQTAYMTAIQEINIKGGQNVNISSGLNFNQLASGNIQQTAAAIHQNGPAADEAKNAEAKPAKWSHRVPAHEPWPRTMTKDDYSHDPEHKYDDKAVNRTERGKTTTRGLFWRR